MGKPASKIEKGAKDLLAWFDDRLPVTPFWEKTVILMTGPVNCPLAFTARTK